MKKEFAVRALKKIKEIQKHHAQLKKLGVSFELHENIADSLEEAICILFTDNDKDFEKALADVQWWLYENVEKVILVVNLEKIDVKTPEKFIDWLEKFYKTKK